MTEETMEQLEHLRRKINKYRELADVLLAHPEIFQSMETESRLVLTEEVANLVNHMALLKSKLTEIVEQYGATTASTTDRTP